MFTKISDPQNLLKAYYMARRGKREKFSVCDYDFHLENNIIKQKYILQRRRYTPRPYTRFLVFDPKTRLVSAPAFEDRVLHHSIIAQIEPLFDKQFIYDSYACRKNKGTHLGAKRVKKFLMAARCIHGKDKDLYILQCDIQKYFQSIDWEILLKIISKTINCPKTMDLIRTIIYTHETVGRCIKKNQTEEQLSLFDSVEQIPMPVSVENRKGLPIGNLTSQLFANVYLNELDHFVKEVLRERWYARYMDDFLIIHPDRKHLCKVREQIRAFLTDNLALSLHPRKVSIKNVKTGVPFVGYRIFYDHKLVRGSTLLRMQKKYRSRIKSFKNGDLSEKDLKSVNASLNGHLKHANAYNLRKTMITVTM